MYDHCAFYDNCGRLKLAKLLNKEKALLAGQPVVEQKAKDTSIPTRSDVAMPANRTGTDKPKASSTAPAAPAINTINALSPDDEVFKSRYSSENCMVQFDTVFITSFRYYP